MTAAKIKEAITDYWGMEHIDFAPGCDCECCAAWGELPENENVELD